MASRAHHPVLPRLDDMEPERPPPPLVSELLEEIFLRVASPADLARASAACVCFRRLISNPSFLCRYRSVHPPLLLGFLHTDTAGFQPVDATHPSAAIARAVARTADFSFNFLPTPRDWYPSDVRDGRVLVQRRLMIEKLHMGTEHRFSCDFAVCDPLFQQYLLLPPITGDLLASVGLNDHDIFNFKASLIPSGGMEEETSSIVICLMISITRLVVFIFSTSSGHWAVSTSISRRVDLGFYGQLGLLDPHPHPGQYVYGCFYWKAYHRNKLLKLDMSTMELSKYDLPPGYDMRCVAIVETGEGKVGMFGKVGLGESTYLEYYTLLQNDIEKSYKWHLKSTIPLPVHDTGAFLITGQAEGYVFLEHIIEVDAPYVEFFSLEVKSCNIERVCSCPATLFGLDHPYFGFPPSMSPRRIQGYGED